MKQLGQSAGLRCNFLNVNLGSNADSSRRKYITDEIAKIGKGNIAARIFTYRELCVATQNFHPDNLLGEGGFGRVYKGHLDCTNQVLFQSTSLVSSIFSSVPSSLYIFHLINPSCLGGCG